MEKIYQRICEKCGAELNYKSRQSYSLAIKNNSLCRSCGKRKSANRNSDLSILLEDTYETFYWMGFLLADGNFYDNKVRLTLATKDKDHLCAFARYINYSTPISETKINVYLASKNVELVPKICEKFDINTNKTYFPPKTITSFSKDLQYCLLAGFIDGDGCISYQSGRTDFILRIKNHSSWLEILKEFNILIDGNSSHTRINSSGYAELGIYNQDLLRDLKKKINSYNLPLLQRKWEKIK